MTVITRRFPVLLLIVSALPLFAAQTHRHSTAPSVPLITITGKVTDADTGAPVKFADITNSPQTAQTDLEGNYSIQVPLGLPSTVSVSRSGYETSISNIVGRNALTLDFKLKGKPTVTMKLKDGTSYNLDPETSQFGIEIQFSGTARSDNVLVCNGSDQVSINKSQIAKITGPGVLVTNSQCCASTPVVKLTMDLKDGTHRDALLASTCTGQVMEFSGRDHVSGLFVYKQFDQITEIDFP